MKSKGKLFLFVSITLVLLTPLVFSHFNIDQTEIFYFKEGTRDENVKLASSGNAVKVLVFFNSSFINNYILNNFTSSKYGGNITNLWNSTFDIVSGFSGNLPNENYTLFEDYLNSVSGASIEMDEIMETEMSYATVQTQAINSTWYNNGFKGLDNSSIAVLDTGVNANQSYFPLKYEPADLNGSIVGWEDFISKQEKPYDDNGHGTFVSSVISGTGDNQVPTIISIENNYTHLDFFNEFTPSKNYSIKLLTFNVSKGSTYVNINSSWFEDKGDIDKVWFELYNTVTKVSYTFNKFNNTIFKISYRVGYFNDGIYNLYVKYHKSFNSNPTLSVKVNMSYHYESHIENYSINTGISNKTKIVSYKVANQSGLGYSSNLISALRSVKLNKSKYHITCVCLSIGTLGEDVSFVSSVIDDIIKNGTLVIIATGNDGVSTSSPLNKLARNKNAIVVGAINDLDHITSYSSAGGELEEEDYIKPDIVAPGGSTINNQRTILSGDAFSNGTTTMYGTSISTAIVAGVVSNIIEAKWKNWSNYNALNLTEVVKEIKSILLLTASETNLDREDDPNTDIDESDYSPTLYSIQSEWALKDPHEGYGRINAQAAIDSLTKRIAINQTVNGTLANSESDPLASHVFARRINLTANTQYVFNLTAVSPFAELDLFLYSNESTEHGDPILLGSSRTTYDDLSYLYFTPKKNQTECIITVKARIGSSFFNLTVNNIQNSLVPELTVPELEYTDDDLLKNATIMSMQEYDLGIIPYRNYTIDKYRFFVQYKDHDADNVLPQEIYVSIIELNRNISLTRYNSSFQPNFTKGELYWSEEVQFKTNGTYHYFFVASDGLGPINLPFEGNFSIEIFIPLESAAFPYAINFASGYPGGWSISGEGWGILQQNNTIDNREQIYDTSWKTAYFGQDHNYATNYTYQIPIPDEDFPNGIITSPLLNLTDLGISVQPYVKVGLRLSINSGDYAYLQINPNWTGWITLKTYTEIEKEWFIENINISKYKGNYIQFRINVETDEEIDPVNYKGIMFDYFALYDFRNNIAPEITFNYTLNYFPRELTEFDDFSFSCFYYDQENNYPTQVSLEIDGTKYEMYNLYGDWDAISLKQRGRGIEFNRTLILGGFSNYTFRFHATDGKFSITSKWYIFNESHVTFIEPKELDYNLQISGKDIGYQFSNDSTDDYYITGNPNKKENSAWFRGDNTWHPIIRAKAEYLYGGLGNSFGSGFQGYGTNWDICLITKPIRLLSDYDVFLKFDYQFSFQSETNISENDADRCVVYVSDDYGGNWDEILEYNYNSEELVGNESIDLSDYPSDTIMVKFRFISNDNVPLSLGYGCLLSNIYIGYDKSTDLIPPEIKFIDLKNNDIINSVFNITINITDNIELDSSKIQLFIDNQIVDVEQLQYNASTHVLLYSWDTTLDMDGTKEIRVVAYDAEGNRAESILTVFIDNGLLNWNRWGFWIVILFIGIASAIGLYIFAEKKGKYLVMRLRNNFAESVRLSEIDKEQVIKIIEEIEEGDSNNPLTLYCKSCSTWYSSNEFDIMCPTCKRDDIYVAYNCMNCGKWNFRDEPRNDHFCDKCNDIKLLRRSKEEINEILLEKGKIPKPFEKSRDKISILDL